MRILFVTECYGFGPTSNCFTIIKSLKAIDPDLEIFCIKNSAVEYFVKKHSYLKVELVDKFSSLSSTKSPDIVISILNLKQ